MGRNIFSRAKCIKGKCTILLSGLLSKPLRTNWTEKLFSDILNDKDYGGEVLTLIIHLSTSKANLLAEMLQSENCKTKI